MEREQGKPVGSFGVSPTWDMDETPTPDSIVRLEFGDEVFDLTRSQALTLSRYLRKAADTKEVLA
jgi:hypothetical protein